MSTGLNIEDGLTKRARVVMKLEPWFKSETWEDDAGWMKAHRYREYAFQSGHHDSDVKIRISMMGYLS